MAVSEWWGRCDAGGVPIAGAWMTRTASLELASWAYAESAGLVRIENKRQRFGRLLTRFSDGSTALFAKADLARTAAIHAALDAIIKPASEPVTLADGAADQSLIPGVAPVALSARQLDAERQRREQRHGHAPLPCGGLWDETSINQRELF